MGLSLSHLLLVLVVVLIVFGAGKLPRVMGDLARGLKAFKDGLTDEDAESSSKSQVSPPKSASKKPKASSRSQKDRSQ